MVCVVQLTDWKFDMPYITKKQRPPIDLHIKKLVISDEGELNYAACSLFMNYIDNQEGPITYRKIQAGLGALNEAVAELRRRVLNGYEHQKIIENGDIFTDFIRRHNIREIS